MSWTDYVDISVVGVDRPAFVALEILMAYLLLMPVTISIHVRSIRG